MGNIAHRKERGFHMTFAAEFTNGSQRRQPVLTFTRIENGRRTVVSVEPVAGKRDARALAAERGAVCWNF
jgi:hypothetical protein